MSLDRLLSQLEVKVQPFSLCILSGGWRLRLPKPAEPVLHFVLQGTGRIEGIRGDKHTLAPYHLAVVPLGTAHHLESGAAVRREFEFDARQAGPPIYRIVAGSPDKPDLMLACGMITVRYGRTLGLFDHLRSIVSVNLADVPQVREAFATILAEQSRPAEGGQALTAAMMSAALVYLFRRLAEKHSGTLPWLLALEDSRLGRAIDLMLGDPAYSHSLESLADAAGMSRSAFAERFGESFGRTPMAMLHGIRMDIAAKLLHEGGHSMDAVAEQVGFSSRSHFSQAFKKHHGVSPTRHRNGQTGG
ncbi:MAG: helix-turn-helix transcriptional regulator [Verrucomicrobia bacterium]|nr:helix-turn-helix transcriptional regulator [Verrucomicrobiota bacterium]